MSNPLLTPFPADYPALEQYYTKNAPPALTLSHAPFTKKFGSEQHFNPQHPQPTPNSPITHPQSSSP
jgi:hypothetical protein